MTARTMGRIDETRNLVACPIIILMPFAHGGWFGGSRKWDERADRTVICRQVLMGDSLHILRRNAAYPFQKLIDVPPAGAYGFSLAEHHRLPKVRVLTKEIFGFHLVLRPL